MARMLIGEMLLAGGDITAEQLKEALELQEKEGGRLGVILVRLGFVTESIIASYLARQTSNVIDRLKGS